jgi:hypothetical protein
MAVDQRKNGRPCGAAVLQSIIVEKKSVLGRPGSDLLFQALRLSTIGAEEFNGRVRDGNGFRLLAKTTRSAKDGFASWFSFQCRPFARGLILKD